MQNAIYRNAVSIRYVFHYIFHAAVQYFAEHFDPVGLTYFLYLIVE